MAFFKCMRYLCTIGVFSFFLGRVLPKHLFRPESPLFTPKPFEKDGAFYERFRIRLWQKKVPDMSKLFPQLMPEKALKKGFHENLERMLQETCIAEAVHLALIFFSLPCLYWMPGITGVLLWAIYNLLFNLPYIFIQRYNRPRLMRLQQRITKKREESVANRLTPA